MTEDKNNISEKTGKESFGLSNELRKFQEHKRIKSKPTFNKKCNPNCPCHRLVTHNACLWCPALRNSPYHKGEFDDKSDEDIAKIINELEEEI